jgi:hypothetical protein
VRVRVRVRVRAFALAYSVSALCAFVFVFVFVRISQDKEAFCIPQYCNSSLAAVSNVLHLLIIHLPSEQYPFFPVTMMVVMMMMMIVGIYQYRNPS